MTWLPGRVPGLRIVGPLPASEAPSLLALLALPRILPRVLPPESRLDSLGLLTRELGISARDTHLGPPQALCDASGKALTTDRTRTTADSYGVLSRPSPRDGHLRAKGRGEGASSVAKVREHILVGILVAFDLPPTTHGLG